MKFGAHLQEAIIEEWQPYYLDYDSLKAKLIKTEKDQPFSERDEMVFVEMLDSNLEKVNAFHVSQMNRIREEIDSCATEISTHLPSQDTISKLAQMQEKINSIADDINHLEKFTRFNYTGFLKIVKKHDRHTGYILRPMFMVRLNQCPFWREAEDNDALLIKLSTLFSQVRGGGKTMSFQPVPSSKDVPQAHDDSRRTVVKRFLVHTSDVTELKTSVLRHLPVLVYRNLDDSTQEDIDPPISSLYLDNAELDSYCSRVESAPASKIIRLRWYGSAKGNRSISVERRTLEDETRGELNDKFFIKDKYVYGFLHGEKIFLKKSVKKMTESGRTQEDIDAYTDLVNSAQQIIIKNHMQPLLRTYYKRTAFQIPGETSVRMALDTDLCFLREDSGLFPNEPAVRRPNHCWRRPDADINFPFSNLKEDIEMNRYLFATFEIKLKLGPFENEPKWILDLEQSGLLEEAYQFSKFVHGMAIMFDTRVPLLPYWLAQIDEDSNLLPELPSQIPSVTSKVKIHQSSLSKTESFTKSQASKSSQQISESSSLLQHRNQGSTSYMSINQTPSTCRSSSINHKPRTIWQKIANAPEYLLGLISVSQRQQVNTAANKTSLPPGVKIPKKVVTPIRVEPKVFFANERTYFAWMQFGAMLSTFSLALFNSGDAVGKLSGIVYTLISLSTLIYAVGLYYRRRELMRARLAGPYDEMFGPTVICFALMFAVGMNAFLKFSIPAPNLFNLYRK